MTTKTEGRLYVATESFTTEIDGQPVTIRQGVDRVREGHRLMQGREHLFELAPVDYDVEQMTAAPGERRGG